MTKWKADFLISKVRYDEKHNYITMVKTSIETEEEKIKDYDDETKETVIKKLKDKIYFTMYFTEKKEWKLGDEVECVENDGKKYLRTKGNIKIEDNLGELPEF